MQDTLFKVHTRNTLNCFLKIKPTKYYHKNKYISLSRRNTYIHYHKSPLSFSSIIGLLTGYGGGQDN